MSRPRRSLHADTSHYLPTGTAAPCRRRKADTTLHAVPNENAVASHGWARAACTHCPAQNQNTSGSVAVPQRPWPLTSTNMLSDVSCNTSRNVFDNPICRPARSHQPSKHANTVTCHLSGY
ncbi:hypothetical protein BBAD15_g12569 [Beauveria bassiana D1-5]|uniref:Uncharacterized protein n=1 Tax=Beauveria bassiana D1-5 TaxID=1245745 RepID=A0A0A2V7E4_BEABA|nr:hypothetical protein BBAD15_g12569 [Beauveria bassiana D1-5]